MKQELKRKKKLSEALRQRHDLPKDCRRKGNLFDEIDGMGMERMYEIIYDYENKRKKVSYFTARANILEAKLDRINLKINGLDSQINQLERKLGLELDALCDFIKQTKGRKKNS
jgi:hypothetical protein